MPSLLPTFFFDVIWYFWSPVGVTGGGRVTDGFNS